jgi:hypothetical protein
MEFVSMTVEFFILRESERVVYFIYNNQHIKIGCSKNPHKRMKQLQTSSPQRLILLGYVHGDKKLERELHDKFSHLHVNLEWFNVNSELVRYINDNNCMMNWIDLVDDGHENSSDGRIMIYAKMMM